MRAHRRASFGTWILFVGSLEACAPGAAPNDDAGAPPPTGSPGGSFAAPGPGAPAAPDLGGGGAAPDLGDGPAAPDLGASDLALSSLFDPVVTQAIPPPAISGGTLLVTADGALAV